MTTEIDLRPIGGFNLDLDQYFGLWAVEDSRFLAMLDRVAKLDLAEHVRVELAGPGARGEGREAARAAAEIRAGEETQIAVIDIQGTLTKRGSSLSAGGSMIRLRQAVRRAAQDSDVDAIVLRIDSPGGTVSGTADLAKEVARASQQKPVVAYVEDLTASAAYWIASQAGKVFANDRTAWIGSIGTYMGLYDYSGMAGQEGVKAVVIRSGEFKGAGFPGTEITAEQQDYWQTLVDKTQVEFSAAVAAGRKLSAAKVAQLADGRVHMAEDARALGLIDGIQTFEETLTQLQAQLPGKRSNLKPRNQIMSEESTKAGDQLPAVVPVEKSAAEYGEIVAACPGADEKFICSQLATQATVEQSRQAWMQQQQSRLEAAQQEAEQAKAAAASPGVDALGGAAGGEEAAGGGDWADPVQAWNKAVDEKVAAGMSKQKAASLVNRQNPGLREASVAAYNEEHGRRSG